MKSLYFERYGSWDVLSLRDLPRPKLKPGHVLVMHQSPNGNDMAKCHASIKRASGIVMVNISKADQSCPA